MINKLLNSGYIRFEKLVIDNYYKLGLSEAEAMILIKLNEIKKESNYLSIPKLKEKTSMKREELDKVIESLVEKEFLSFEISENNGVFEESFNINKAIDKLLNNRDTIDQSEIVVVIEENFKRVLTNKELEVVSHIKCTTKELTRGIIICLQKNILDVNYLKKTIESWTENQN